MVHSQRTMKSYCNHGPSIRSVATFGVSMITICLLGLISSSDALSSRAARSKPAIKQSALPTFNAKTQRWVPGKDAEIGYDIVGTLLRNGPVPTFTRLTSPDDYQQAVFKFQAKEKCDINTAQGNMDAYFENPNDRYVSISLEKNTVFLDGE